MKDFKIYLLIASLILIGYVLVQYNKPKDADWTPTLNSADKIPFGTYIFYHQLNDIFPGAKITNNYRSAYRVFSDDSLSSSNYIIIAKTLKINKVDFKEMVKYIKRGNSVFIAAFEFGNYLEDTLKLTTGLEYAKVNVGLNFTNSHLKQARDYAFRADISNQYFKEFDTTRAVVLGQNENEHCNFLRFSYGKGYLYVCANPQLFTNYNLLNKRGSDYVQKAISYLPVQSNIYWDEYQNGNVEMDTSPLRVFFSHENLRWAYYISLFSLIIFVLYEKKRRQRIIPVIEPLKNTTVEFVNVVGQVYFEQRDNNNITAKKVMYFLEHLRTRYNLKTNVLDKEFVEKMANKTGIAEVTVRELINYINYLYAQQKITDHELITLNQLIEQFYSKAGE